MIPDEISALEEHLVTFIISNNNISVVPIQLFSLSNLIKLDISHNHISDIEDLPFHNLMSLNELILDHNKINKVSPIYLCIYFIY